MRAPLRFAKAGTIQQRVARPQSKKGLDLRQIMIWVMQISTNSPQFI